MSANITSASYKQLEERSKIKNLLLRWFLYFVLILFASYFIFPLYVMVVTSFKTMEEIRQGTLLTWPSQLNFESWAVAWGGRGYGAGDTFLRPYFWNSIKMVVPAVIFSTFIGAMTGYVLTKWRFKGDRWVFLFLLFGCFIPYQAILLPMARTLGELGISNSILGLVVVHSVYGIPFTTLFFRNYFVSIPNELIKAARIDGAGFFKIFFKICYVILYAIVGAERAQLRGTWSMLPNRGIPRGTTMREAQKEFDIQKNTRKSFIELCVVLNIQSARLDIL